MEGDGPIMGTPAAAGVLVMGTNLPAVDATAARLMGIDPGRVPYLAVASGRLGPIAERHIRQRGEPIVRLHRRFALLDDPSLSRASRDLGRPSDRRVERRPNRPRSETTMSRIQTNGNRTNGKPAFAAA